MRKRVIQPVPDATLRDDQAWLPLAALAQVELTSEDPAFPIETALQPGAAPGWRAAEPGAQTIRLLFDRPHRLNRIRLVFVESESPHAGVRPAVVAGPRAVVPRDHAPAMEF